MNKQYTLTKTKTPQPKTPGTQQVRDLFLTPRYAVKLLNAYIPESVTTVWDVGAGCHYIGNVFESWLYDVVYTDIDNREDNVQQNFILDNSADFAQQAEVDMLVSNVPFSLKKEFIETAIEIGLPFAFLMPFDMNGYLWKVFREYGLQGIVPERRIDFITPNALSRANEFIGVQAVNRDFKIKAKSLKDLSDNFSHIQWHDTYNNNVGSYKKIEHVPTKTLRHVSSSDFHSFWLVGGFDLEKDFTFVQLSNEDKNHIF